MLTVQYSGAEKTVGHTVWYPGETRQATPRQLAAWQAEHGDVFAVVGGAVPPAETEPAATEVEPKAKRK